jgi:hypothetical protein
METIAERRIMARLLDEDTRCQSERGRVELSITPA